MKNGSTIKKIFRKITFGLAIVLFQFATPQFCFERASSAWAEVLTEQEENDVRSWIKPNVLTKDQIIEILNKDETNFGNNGLYSELRQEKYNSRDARSDIGNAIIGVINGLMERDRLGDSLALLERITNKSMALFLIKGNNIIRYDTLKACFPSEKECLYAMTAFYKTDTPQEIINKMLDKIKERMKVINDSRVISQLLDLYKGKIAEERKPEDLKNVLMSIYLCYDTCEGDLVKIIKLFLFEDGDMFDNNRDVRTVRLTRFPGERDFITLVRENFLLHISKHWVDHNHNNINLNDHGAVSGYALYEQLNFPEVTDMAQRALKQFITSLNSEELAILKILINGNKELTITKPNLTSSGDTVFTNINRDRLKVDNSDFSCHKIAKSENPIDSELPKNALLNLFFKFTIPCDITLTTSRRDNVGSFYIRN